MVGTTLLVIGLLNMISNNVTDRNVARVVNKIRYFTHFTSEESAPGKTTPLHSLTGPSRYSVLIADVWQPANNLYAIGDIL